MKIPPNLKKILDERAGKEHSEDGKVVAALEEILEEYRDMARRNPTGVLWEGLMSNFSFIETGAATVSDVVDRPPFLIPVTNWEQPEVWVGFRFAFPERLIGAGSEEFSKWLRDELFQIDPDLAEGRIIVAPVIDATIRGVVEP